jgi:hypothetical protein
MKRLIQNILALSFWALILSPNYASAQAQKAEKTYSDTTLVEFFPNGMPYVISTYIRRSNPKNFQSRQSHGKK